MTLFRSVCCTKYVNIVQEVMYTVRDIIIVAEWRIVEINPLKV